MVGWSHNVAIFDKCKDDLEREFYIRMTKSQGWTKNVLIHQIENRAYEKMLLAQTNFDALLPNPAQAKLAVKDEYLFDFLELGDEFSERQLETAILARVEPFLKQMGGAFAFVGSQYRLQVSDQEYFLDLLLYHRGLQCLVAIELKIGAFLPEYVGKMQFYLAVLDDTVKTAGENASIGIILCKTKDRMIVEYALRESNKPIGVGSYKMVTSLPARTYGAVADTGADRAFVGGRFAVNAEPFYKAHLPLVPAPLPQPGYIASLPVNVKVSLTVWLRGLPARAYVPNLLLAAFFLAAPLLVHPIPLSQSGGFSGLCGLLALDSALLIFAKLSLTRRICHDGSLCPAIVVSVNPPLVAVGADLSKTAEEAWPAIKILRQPLHTFAGPPLQVGDRLPAVALYHSRSLAAMFTYEAIGLNVDASDEPHWSDISPAVVPCVTDDPATIQDARRRLSESGDVWAELEANLALVPKPYKPGLYWMRQR